ncbi:MULTISPECIES: serine hydrolase [Streptomyces]|uniref:serine hydrolase n=1 Tax=Streptomyces TaxID=1883 RepID=UPI001EFB9563|nr:serine hydrolase [Streptomyces sp. CL12-4]MCG8968826.1 serine hydrolase [Streptomyces sp. CL12-4]
MSHLRYMPRLKSAPRRSRRVGARAGVLLASVTALCSLGGLHTVSALAAPSPSEQTHATAGVNAAVQRPSKARVTAAVLSLDGGSGRPLLDGEDAPYDTASIVKVDILATLLLQAQDTGRHLTAQERALAEPMIRNSDNAATNALWRVIGGAPALEAANKRMGLTSTKGGPGAKWGLTQTTASDQIRLLLTVFDGTATSKTASPLNKDSRAYIQTLMTRVASDQAWGVSAASGSDYALKNGWLQRTTSGLWDVNSVGRVTVDGHRYLVAVLSGGSVSMSDGISLVERAARQAVAAATRT